MINVAVLGARGRMGSEVVKAVEATDGLALIAALDLGDSLEQLKGSAAHVVVDFTTPDSVMSNLEFLINNGINVVVGTTGFDDAKLATVKGWLAQNPSVGVLIAPNFAIGAVLMMEFAEKAARYFESAEIIELHHPAKVDAPSGTALRLGEAVAKASGRDLKKDAQYERYGNTGERKQTTIGFSTIRGGDIVGDHTVLFAGTGERIELTHKASSRATFAKGALRAAKFLSQQKTGLFDMQKVLGLSDQ